MELEQRSFSNQELMQWRELLENRKAELLRTEEALRKDATQHLSAEGVGEISKIRLHPADLASDTQQMATLESLSKKNVIRLREIDDALERLDRGTFGVCEECGENISVQRLKVIPESRYCIDCLEEFELMQKRTPSFKPAPRTPLFQGALEVTEGIARLSVSDIMQKDPVTVRSEESVETAANILYESNFRHLPVVDDKGDIQGIISDRDILQLFLNRRTEKIQVQQIMTKTPETVGPETTLSDAGATLIDHKISCLPVVEGTRLIGIVTESDFVKLVAQASDEL